MAERSGALAASPPPAMSRTHLTSGATSGRSRVVIKQPPPARRAVTPSLDGPHCP